MKKNVLLFFALISFQLIDAQGPIYKAMMEDYHFNFYQVCDSAEAYFKNRDKGKGSGYKPFLRWKFENESKYYPTGNRLVDEYLPFKEYTRIKSAEPSSISNRLFLVGGWKSMGPDTMGAITGHYSAGLGQVIYVEVNRANSQHIYMGSRSGGLWRTNNGGSTWSHNTDFLPASGVNAISASPSNFDSVLINIRNASNGTSFGIYRSTNGGTTFSVTPFNPTNPALGFGGLGSDFKISVIKYHPRVPNLIFVGTDRGIYRSTDNLQTWVRTNTAWNVKDIEFHPTNNNIIYVYENYYWGTNRNKIFKSTNQGVSYVGLIDLPGNANASINIVTVPSLPNCIFASSDNGIWKSFNEGVTFNTTVSPAPTGVSLFYAAPNELDTSKYVSGYVDLFKSNNGGITSNQCSWWSLGSTTNHGGFDNQSAYNLSNVYVHADCNYLTNVNGAFYACTDGFLCKSVNNGLTWQKLSLSTGIRENYNLGVSQSNHYRTICGSQDNGLSLKTENGWIEFYGADGMEGIIHPLNDKWIIGSTQNGGRRRTFDGGLTTSGVTQPQSGSWIAPMVYDPNDHMTVYSFAKNVFKSADFGSTWTMLGAASTFSADLIEYASIAENNSNIMVITRSEKIELSTNGGLTFTSIKNTLPNNWITDVVFDPNRDSTIIVTYDSYQNNGQKIYITKNLGLTWQNITYNLGSMPIKSVAIDHTDSSTIYIGATIGVYKKSMNATTWQLYNADLPNVAINELEINYGSNTLKAATWGRGLWEYALSGRVTFPAIVTTSITSGVTFLTPKETINQYVTSFINYTGSTLTSVYVKWSYGAPTFTSSIVMNAIGGGNWKSATPLPNGPVGSTLFFKVFAVGSNGDTTETYKFMYKIKPFNYCTASATTDGNNMHINRFRLANIDKASANTTYTFYPSSSVILYKDSVYNTIGNFNMGISGFNDFNVWIDYNADADLSLTERVVNKPNFMFSGPATTNATFTVPTSATLGTTLLRARYAYWGNGDDPCGTTLGEVEDYPVIIRQAPILTFTGSTIFCIGSNLNFNYTGTAADSLKWVLSNGINTYNINGSSVAIAINNIGTYSVTLMGYKYGLTFTKIFSNYFSTQPLPIIAVNSGTTCSGNTFTIIPSGALTYTFSGGSNSVSPTVTTTYSVTGTSSVGCVSALPAVSTVTVKPLPIINASTSNSLICAGGSATLTATGGVTYLWNTSSTATTVVISPSITTIYNVNGLGINGCSNTVFITQNVSTCTDILSILGKELVADNVFPNPNNGLFYINLNQASEVSITDALGKLVYKNFHNKGINNFELLNISDGIYFVAINSNHSQKISKLVIKK
jgi:hypothetical protein